MGRKKKEEEHENHERWLVSYADFITLLFAFFVVMFASSQEDKEKREQMETAMKGAFNSLSPLAGPGGGAGSLIPTTAVGGAREIVISFDSGANGGGLRVPLPPLGETPPEHLDGDIPETESAGGYQWPEPPRENPLGEDPENPGDISFEGDPQLERVYDDLQSELGAEIQLDKMEIRKERRGIVISLNEAGFFDSGKAELKPQSLATIDAIAKRLRNLDGNGGLLIRVEGHSDDRPLRFNARYRDNMELSTARANSVRLRMMSHHGFDPARLVTSGYGEYHPIDSNDTAEGRANNRRVDLVILSHDASENEPL